MVLRALRRVSVPFFALHVRSQAKTYQMGGRLLRLSVGKFFRFVCENAASRLSVWLIPTILVFCIPYFWRLMPTSVLNESSCRASLPILV